MKLPAYPRYKSSLPAEASAKAGGVEWLGDVPEHWTFPPLANRYTVELGKMLNEGRITGEHLVSYLRNVDVQWDQINTDDLPEMDITQRERERFTVRIGDLLVCEGGEVGRAAIAGQEVSGLGFQKALHRLRARNGSEFSRFLFYTFAAASSAGAFMAGGNPNTIPHLTGEKLRRYRFPVPPPAEQRSIAAFLDRETGRVDRLVAKKRELIERLKEKRTALISRTVTRGLPAEAAAKAGLPAHPPLKPSVLDWLGDIPAHWAVKRLKFELWKIEQGWSPQCDNTPADEGEWGVLKAGAVNGPEFDPNENKRLPDEERPLPEFEIKTGDFLISRANTRELLGSAALVRKVQPRLLLCDKLYRLTIRNRTLNSEFLLRFMRSTPGHFEFERDASGSSASMQNIGQQSVRNLWIPVPPLPEQAAIAAYLDEETAKLDALVGKVEEAVERLQEYRTALITAAVTGKIDVRDMPRQTTNEL